MYSRLQLLSLVFISACCEDRYHHPNLITHWKEAPTIELCEDLGTKSSLVTQQLKWLMRISISYEYEGPLQASCHTKPKQGTLRIQKADPKELAEKEAEAFAHLEHQHFLRYAIVYLPKDAKAEVIRHELLHAYGWDHFPDYDHLMYHDGIGPETYELDLYP